jgi:hypothetical protein
VKAFALKRTIFLWRGAVTATGAREQPLYLFSTHEAALLLLGPARFFSSTLGCVRLPATHATVQRDRRRYPSMSTRSTQAGDARTSERLYFETELRGARSMTDEPAFALRSPPSFIGLEGRIGKALRVAIRS